MIAPYHAENERRTAADRLAGDATTAALKHAQHLVQQARARVDMKVSRAIAEAMTPLVDALADLEKRMMTHEADN